MGASSVILFLWVGQNCWHSPLTYFYNFWTRRGLKYCTLKVDDGQKMVKVSGQRCEVIMMMAIILISEPQFQTVRPLQRVRGLMTNILFCPWDVQKCMESQGRKLCWALYHYSLISQVEQSCNYCSLRANWPCNCQARVQQQN